MSCGATCKMILHDAMPRITTLCIDKSSQMNLAVASRFRDIRELRINSLFIRRIYEAGTDDEFGEVELDLETKICVVPFLSRFPLLEKVRFGGKKDDGTDIEGFILASECYNDWQVEDIYPNEGARESMLSFLDLISGAYKCGSLSKRLKLSGLCCPNEYYGSRNSSSCQTCLRACKSFPLEQVVEFECRRSSIDNGLSGRMYGLDVCLDRAKIDSIVESRSGGKKSLLSEDRLLRHLGRGRRYRINAQKTLHFVKYKKQELDEIKRVIEYAEMDVKKLSMESVSNAIMNSFAMGSNNDIIPCKKMCILSEASLDYLVNEIGLPVDRLDLETDLMKHIQQFVWVLMQCHDANMNDRFCEYTDIEIDCLKVVRHYLKGNKPSIQQVIELIPCLVQFTNLYAYNSEIQNEKNLEAAHVLKNIFVKGTDEDRKKVVREGALVSFNRMLDSPKEPIVNVALLSLVEIAIKGTSDNIDTIAELGAIPKLIRHLDSKHMDFVQSSLQILAAAKDHIKVHSHTILLRRVIRIMNMKESHQSDSLSNCAVLLRDILEADSPRPIQTVINLDLVPRLIEILSTTKDEAIRLNLEHVMINLLAGTNEQVELLVANVGFIPVLVSLAESQDSAISEKAISIVAKVVGMKDKYQGLLLQSGIITPLLRVLKDSNVVSTLESVSSTLVSFCRVGKLTNFDTSKEALKVLTELLVINDETVVVVCNSCWGLYHILRHLTYEEVNEAINIGFIKPLLGLLSTPYNVHEPVLKSLHLLSSRSDECIEAISLCNGISYLSKTLLSITNQELIAWTISNIISGSRDKIQTAIDNNLAPSLVQMLAMEKDKAEPKKAALWTLYQMTKAGSSSHVKCLVSEGCLNKLFDLFGNTEMECNTAMIGIWTLKNIIKAGKEQSPNTSRLPSSGVLSIEKKLQEMIEMNLQFEQNDDRVELIEKKIAWLKFDRQNARVQSLKNVAGNLLKEQLRDNDERLQELIQKIADIDKKSPLGHA